MVVNRSADGSGINMQISTKGIVTIFSLLFFGLVGGNAGVSFLTTPGTYADPKIEKISSVLNAHIESNEDDNDILMLSIDGVKSEQAGQRNDIGEIQDLIRNNSEQLNRLLGRMDALLENRPGGSR